MRITIAAVGRLKAGGERVLVDRYLERLAGAKAIGLGPVNEREIGESRLGSSALRRDEEAGRLLETVAGADLLVALDERGKLHTSQDLARWVGQRRDAGGRHLAFLLGGADGHGDAVRSAAKMLLSLGPMTLPHGLARAVLAEQLYRVSAILSGHPYHRE